MAAGVSEGLNRQRPVSAERQCNRAVENLMPACPVPARSWRLSSGRLLGLAIRYMSLFFLILSINLAWADIGAAAAMKVSNGNTSILITQSDADAIHASLLAAVMASAIPHRRPIIGMMKARAPKIDEAAGMMLGVWQLELRGEHLVATYRIERTPRHVLNYLVSVKRGQNGWSAGPVETEEIRSR